MFLVSKNLLISYYYTYTMKNFYILLLLSYVSGILAQSSEMQTKNIAAAEMKSASALIKLAVNPNTLNYDITYHKLEFTVDPAVYYISGKVTTTYTALANMNTITFDLANELTVSSVKKNGVSLSFIRNTNNELIITLPSTQTTGTANTLEIMYSGAPPVNGFNAFTIQTRGNGSNTLYTLSEPYGARDWWPCKQDLNDKVSDIDVYITAPSQYISVSNGIEPASPVINGSNKTTHFHHGYPIPAYLICMAVTDYTVYNQQAGLNTTASPYYPIINYIYPENYNATITTQLAETPLILNLYETLVGPYPFRNEKYGHAQFGWGGGMEHTTVSFMANFGRSLIAHEMAHQWFGDKVTCGTWKDIWLNEGITEYMSGIVVEKFDGNPSFTAWKSSKINSVTSQTNGNLYLTDAQSTDVNRIFSSRLTYNKGAMVTNMIRLKMGDTNFFQALKNYLNDSALAYGYAITPQFQAHLEAVSGLNFTEFFNDWVYNQGYPTYTVMAQNWGAGQAKITINQTQSHPSVNYFEMPVPVQLIGTNGQTFDTLLDNTTNGQEFIVSVPFSVTGVLFDPNKNIISKNNTSTLGTDTFELAKAIEVYPNPVSNELHVQMPSDISVLKITILNDLGQKVMGSKALDFTVSSLSSGVHFAQIETSEGTYYKKFIKK